MQNILLLILCVALLVVSIYYFISYVRDRKRVKIAFKSKRKLK
ncbi:small membrane protein [Klebsiella variicola]|nr:small membrane protein [Klebsiella variicola]MEC6197819.1 small membrane protein [Klebsiella variicola]HCQ8411077.1 small membrane protein [Klebsiella variicola]